MERPQDSSNQPLRGKNWTDEETGSLIKALETYFPNLQGRGRKARVYERIAFQLKEKHGVFRTAKEIQNKYKSILKEYRNATSVGVKDNDMSSNFKWFAQIDALIKCTLSCNQAPINATSEFCNLSVTCKTTRRESATRNERTESLTTGSPLIVCTEVLQSTTADLEFRGDKITAQAIESQVPDDTSLATKGLARKRKITFMEGESATDATSCAWRLIKDELKEQTKISTQVQEKICDSLDNFNKMIQSLSGALSIIPNLFTQLVQCQATQFSNYSQQNRQGNSVIFSPIPQAPSQQLEQCASAQYVWLLDPTSACSGKVALPGP